MGDRQNFARQERQQFQMIFFMIYNGTDNKYGESFCVLIHQKMNFAGEINFVSFVFDVI